MHTSALVVLLMAPLFSKALTTLACFQWKTLRLLWSIWSLRLLWSLQYEAAIFSQLKCKITLKAKKIPHPTMLHLLNAVKERQEICAHYGYSAVHR